VRIYAHLAAINAMSTNFRHLTHQPKVHLIFINENSLTLRGNFDEIDDVPTIQ